MKFFPFAASQKIYINNAFEFKRDLIKTPIGSSYYVFTYDGVEFYPSIPTGWCLARISAWLEHKKGIKSKIICTYKPFARYWKPFEKQ